MDKSKSPTIFHGRSVLHGGLEAGVVCTSSPRFEREVGLASFNFRLGAQSGNACYAVELMPPQEQAFDFFLEAGEFLRRRLILRVSLHAFVKLPVNPTEHTVG